MSNSFNRDGKKTDGGQRLNPSISSPRNYESYSRNNNVVANHRGYNYDNSYDQNSRRSDPQRGVAGSYQNGFDDNERGRNNDAPFVPPRRPPHNYGIRDERQTYGGASSASRHRLNLYDDSQERNYGASSVVYDNRYGHGNQLDYHRNDDVVSAYQLDHHSQHQYQYSNGNNGISRHESNSRNIDGPHGDGRHRPSGEIYYGFSIQHNYISRDPNNLDDPRHVQSHSYRNNNLNGDQRRETRNYDSDQIDQFQEYPEADDSWITRGREGFFNGRRPITSDKLQNNFEDSETFPSSSNKKPPHNY